MLLLYSKINTTCLFPLDCAFENYRNIYKSEISLSLHLKELKEALIHQNIHTSKPTVPFQLAGSIKEGGFSSKLFKTNKRFRDGINRELEFDIEYSFLEFPLEYKHSIQDIANKRGFAKLSSNISDLIHYHIMQKSRAHRWIKRLKKLSTTDGYIGPYVLKKYILGLNSILGRRAPPLDIAKLMFSLVFNSPYNAVQFTEVQQNVTKATLNYQFSLSISEKLKLILGIDAAIVVKLNWIPATLQKWLARPKNWPSLHRIVDEVKSGYLIAKPSVEEKLNLNTTEWRYSFANIERKLISMHSYTQRLVYIIFKSIFYKWVQPIDTENLSSFIPKTIMFWLSERYPPSSRYWQADRHSITRILKQLFSELHMKLQNKHLPYYFNPELNILYHMPAETRRKAEVLVRRISIRVEDYVPDMLTTSKVFEVVEDWERMFFKGKEYLESVKGSGVAVLIAERPDLLSHLSQSYKSILMEHLL